MKKILALLSLLVVLFAGYKLKIGYDQYVYTHLPAKTVVYYVPRHVYLHIQQDCPKLYGGWGYMAKQDTYGKMKNSKMSNELCPVCVPSQYIN